MPSTTHPPYPSPPNALSLVSFEPVPHWVKSHEAAHSVARKDSDALTQLLIDRQHDLASRTVFDRRVLRLENMDAVQHLSQWTLDFSPLTQQVVLHDLTVIRNGERKQYAIRENIRLLNRERNLEAFIVDGMATLLIVLADIRVGDIIDQSLSITTRPHLLEDDAFGFYTLPPETQIGAFHYSITAPSGELPKWASSDALGDPEQRTDAGHETLSWELAEVSRFETERNTPAWQLPPAWISFSTIESWERISSATAQAWPACGDTTAIDEIVSRVKSEHADQASQIEALIAFVQDDFRYLSVTESFGGQIPAAPETVLSRRYGDCKDLSLLLSTLLRQLGVQARPVVVSADIGRTIPELLPSLNAFNHAIISFFHEDHEYWVDPTAHAQGGGALKRHVSRFYYGLPIESEGCALATQPPIPGKDTYQLHDTILLDTAGGHSLLRIQIFATGLYADHLRERLRGNGENGFSQYLIDRTRDRYKVEKALEEPLYEDDRAENTWKMVELYQLPPLHGSQNGVYGIDLPASLPLNILPFPDSEKRHAPFAIPDGVDVSHTTEIRASSNQAQPGRSELAEFKGIHFSVDTRLKKTVWTHTVALKTQCDHLAPEDLPAFRTEFRSAIQAAGLGIQAAKGHRRLKRESNFFTLPEAASQRAHTSARSRKVHYETLQSGSDHRSHRRTRSGRPRTHAHRSSSSGSRKGWWVMGVVIVVVIKGIVLLTKLGTSTAP
ncbi:DUF3857 domain-containing protein [Ruficoccus sp. ZRK36]|uniref:DUF3857 domain-containing protein n=1 Tax=Ruficoccus sp. ZRK36 TaxID=2866311 RepID=UPI001C73A590|nr:DUF3857 domain-containing protein [Ruficoccus sp. ZRK36]QYY36470.1 DUF3857 domain-containing protein [Ruficoccus sp. ZRK36]